MNFRHARAGRREITLELTSMIDVVFLLLIFFLITTTFVRPNDRTIPVDLPKGVSGTKTGDEKKIVVVIGADGDVQIDGGVVLDGAALQEHMRQAHATTPDAEVMVRGDQKATHGRIVEILDSIKSVGFGRAHLVISSPPSRSPEKTSAGKRAD
jgi:biopolymer transport protein ExbD